METEFFGLTADHESIQRFTLSGGGLKARFINWGAVLQDLRYLLILNIILSVR